MTAQTAWWGGRPGIHSHVSDCGEIRSVDKRCPVPAAPPPPFSSSGLFPPRLRPSLVTTPSKKQTTRSLRTIHFPKLPLSGGPTVLWSAPPPRRTAPLRPPRSGTPPASSGRAEHLDSGLGKVRGGKS